jgi:penicillin-binding protein 1A
MTAGRHGDALRAALTRNLGRRRRRWCLGAVLVIAVTAALGAALLPSPTDLQSRVQALVAVRGDVLLQPPQVPSLLREAVIATEDERFYSNHGIDVVSLGRALWFDASHRCTCQGGSTITEQLVKDVYLNGSDRGPAKAADLAIALKVGLKMPKGQVLADYLSEIPTGRGLYGVPAAACVYFGLSIGELSLADDALLAGIAQAPSAYDPRFDPSAAIGRRAEVLSAMVSEGYVSAQQATAAAATPLIAASDRYGQCSDPS